jgi:endoglucanase
VGRRVVQLTCVLALAACSGTGDDAARGDDAAAADVAASEDGGGRDAGGPGDGGEGTDAASPGFAVKVSGNGLVDGSGKPLRVVGVNHSGSEYACIQGYGNFDSPHDDALAAAMAAWHVNVVRVPLNEDCWLSLNGVKPQYSGATYQSAIADWVKTLHAHGLYTILELHWTAPGATAATGQQPMPDADHAPTFWTQVAEAYKDDPAAIFDLFNEPYVSTSNARTSDPWTCWRDGCTVRASGAIASDWPAAGMQSLVDAVRGAGAANVIMLGGLAYSNDLSGWLTHAPNDPLKQLAASFHVYNFNTCKTEGCWDTEVAPVAAKVPLVTGEIGENDCAHGFIDGYMSWADAHGVSYLGWTFNPWDCSTGPALIVDFAGNPSGFGRGYRDHVLSLFP